MRFKLDVLIAILVIALCAWAVIWQFSDASEPVVAGPIEPLEMGAVLEIDFTLEDMDDLPKPRNLMGWYGRTATVLYTWSVPCPCIEDVEPRLEKLHARYNRENHAVSWVALAGEPGDTREEIRAKMARMGVFYPVLRDPDQLVCRRLGLVHAGQVAVLDGEGRLVYRGAIDADYAEGKAEYLEAVLAAVTAGRPVPVPERERAYGCAFSIPASCLTLTAPGDAPQR